jgi:multiple sugar transport system ATP-binding protein
MNPATLKAADFIGNPRINFISGKAGFGSGSLTAGCGIGSFRFDKKDMTADVPSGDFDCVFGLRPEQIAILTEPEEGAIEARVYADQPAGSETLVSLVVGKDELLAKQIGIRQYAINQTVYLKIDPDKLNIYDKASEKLVKRAV